MKYEFTHKTDNKRLILIFGGWSTDASFYSDIKVEGWNILVAWGYSDFVFPDELLNDYHTIVLFAWSLGVYAAARTLPFAKITTAIAINGTEFPVNDNLGIPTSIFKGTLDSLSEKNLLKFRKRMSGSHYAEIKHKFPPFEKDSLSKELSYVFQDSKENTQSSMASRWNRVYISGNDLIFPSRNQKKAWMNHSSFPEIVFLKDSHFINLENLIKTIVPSKEKVSLRFRRAVPTYDSNAHAQRFIATRLVELIAAKFPNLKSENVLEIGCGTGIFTKLFAERFKPVRSTYIDLYPLPVFNLAPCEKYIAGDAEEWAENESLSAREKYDVVVAASAIQWFANPGRFFRNVSKLMKRDGVLAVSTFLPDNVNELSEVNPFSMFYPPRKSVEEMLHPLFKNIFMEEMTIEMNFDSSRETLLHLRNTGVAGETSSPLSFTEILRKIPTTLTYRPLY
ncbi:MAG: DUF452 family protein, partial [Muribaculaceae bacterium]|nr:DUF452 family protein [Muribaculaceae bacterium]